MEIRLKKSDFIKQDRINQDRIDLIRESELLFKKLISRKGECVYRSTIRCGVFYTGMVSYLYIF